MILGIRQALPGGLVPPHEGERRILGDASTGVVHAGQIVLRARVALLRGLAHPPRRLGIIPRHAVT